MTVTRRRLLAGIAGMATVAAGGIFGTELVDHGVLPGKSELDALDGACDLPVTSLETYVAPGPEISGHFWSKARNRNVGYTIGYPPVPMSGQPGKRELPLIIMLHGFGGDHDHALAGLTPAQAVALRVGGTPLPPVALVTVDGGDGYWNPHPGDDPLEMLVTELIPLCQRQGLGRPPHRIGVMGISMGGYGAILLAEKHPKLISAVAAISPAIWITYAEARSANPGAYASAADFAADDAVTHVPALRNTPVRVASGYDDPFYPGVRALAKALPPGAVTAFGKGCHDNSFFTWQEPASLAFLASHLTTR
jgi:S-formylglutathione hydrolase FrmB